MGFFIWCSSTTDTTLVKTSLPILFFFMFYLLTLKSADAYDSFDPISNITVKWDIKSWTPDGYIAMVTIYNYHKYRRIEEPGWKLGWDWKRKEIIWEMFGGQATEQGDCSRFKSNIPHSCEKHPKIVDLSPGTPYNHQVANCCKGGVLSAFAQDPSKALSMFQIQVGQSGTSNKTVGIPENFTLSAPPGSGHTCGKARIVKPTKFFTPDRMRVTRAFMTWNVVCLYSQTLAQDKPTCCVSLSSFYSETIVDCPTCTCGCKSKQIQQGSCTESDSPHLASMLSSVDKRTSHTPLLHCTNHMCPIRIHWHVKVNYRDYWRVKITVTNFNYRMNYSQWNMVVKHPNFDNITQIFSFNYMPVSPFGFNDTGMLSGLKFYNDLLMQAGPDGNVQSEILFGKDKSKFSFEKGWAFPRKIHFNGDNCVMPPPDSYPFLPNDCATHVISLVNLLTTMLVMILVFV